MVDAIVGTGACVGEVVGSDVAGAAGGEDVTGIGAGVTTSVGAVKI